MFIQKKNEDTLILFFLVDYHWNEILQEIRRILGKKFS